MPGGQTRKVGLPRGWFAHIPGCMKSMTGYGRGECAQHGFKITVELSSVNRKQTEVSVALPRELEVLEAQIRDVINRVIARGRLTARVSLHATEGNQLRPRPIECAAGPGLCAGIEPAGEGTQIGRAGDAGSWWRARPG